MVEKGQRLIMFSGTECVHCKEMDPIVQQLEQAFVFDWGFCSDVPISAELDFDQRK